MSMLLALSVDAAACWDMSRDIVPEFDRQDCKYIIQMPCTSMDKVWGMMQAASGDDSNILTLQTADEVAYDLRSLLDIPADTALTAPQSSSGRFQCKDRRGIGIALLDAAVTPATDII